ncbi:hypothetical protein Tco_0078641 [Tanacetum coccineum]
MVSNSAVMLEQIHKSFDHSLAEVCVELNIDLHSSNFQLVSDHFIHHHLVLLVQKLLLLVLKVNAAGIKVTTAERIKTAQRKDKDCLWDIVMR